MILKKKKIIITVDTEAHTVRAKDNHVQRLILGKQDHRGPSFGIPLMMNIADTYGVKLTFFLDLPEYTVYGEKLLDIGRDILYRGHDLQIHMHPEMFSDDFFTYNALRSEKGFGWDPRSSSPDHIRKYIDFSIQTYNKITTEAPIAYRSIGYKLTPALVDILGKTSIPISCNYNAAFPDRIPFLEGIKKPFLWHTGMLELPVSCIKRPTGKRIEQYNFNTSALLHGNIEDFINNHKSFLNYFYRCNEEIPLAILVMHSWSFFVMDKNGFFSIRNDDAIRKFDAFIKYFHTEYEFITLKDVANNIDSISKKLPIEKKLDYKEYNLYSFSNNNSIHICPLCNTSTEIFTDLYGGIKRQCPTCRSIERQRVFYRLYLKNIFGQNIFKNKKILHIAPTIPERKMFKDLFHISVTTVDIRPEVKPDIVMDITNMHEFQDSTFDVVFCSYVFTCTHKIHEAIKEVHRILKSGGILLCHDPLVYGENTIEFESKDKITAHYGEDAYKRFDIGSFRNFGEKDYTSFFASMFYTKLFMEIDIPTGKRIHWLKGVKRPAVEDDAKGEAPEHDCEAAMP